MLDATQQGIPTGVRFLATKGPRRPFRLNIVRLQISAIDLLDVAMYSATDVIATYAVKELSMSYNIAVDDEVYSMLESIAKPFVDTPNSVLRRVLGLPVGASDSEPQAESPGSGPRKRRSSKKQPASRRTRLPKGELLAESEYELPILQSVSERGGAAPAADVIEDVGRSLAGRFTDADCTLNESGLVRWKSRTQFARLNLVKSGDLDKNSPRGTWRISDAGRARLSREGVGHVG